MASGLLMLLDDIATILDDVSVMTQVAAKKTAGILADDLALNAEQVTGIQASRELPVVWAVAKGSLVNKMILVPSALLLSALVPWLIDPLMIVGGTFLCFEGCEKLAHKFLHPHEQQQHREEHEANVANPTLDIVAAEKAKVRGAIRTDFILSAEIVVITLGTVAAAVFMTQVGVLVAVLGFQALSSEDWIAIAGVTLWVKLLASFALGRQAHGLGPKSKVKRDRT